MATTYPNGPVAPDSGDWIPEDGVKHMQTLAATTDAALAERATTEYVDDGLEDVEAFAEQKYEDATSYTEAVDSASIARDDALAAQIEGMEGMTYVGEWSEGTEYRINDVVVYDGESWARLTEGSEGVPGSAPEDWGLVARRGEGGGFGDLKETDVTGLYETVDGGVEDRLEALEQDTGDLNITSTVPGLTGGTWTIRREGKWVYMNLYDVALTPTAQSYWQQSGWIPSGFRPPAASQYVHFPAAVRNAGFTSGPLRIDRYGGVTIYDIASKLVAVTAAWITNDAFPTTLPGNRILPAYLRGGFEVDPVTGDPLNGIE